MRVIQDLYGVGIRTPWPLPGAPVRTAGAWDVEFVPAESQAFDEARRAIPAAQAGRWAQGAALADGSRYRRWSRLFEFLVSADGRQIRARRLESGSEEAFLAYLLVDALSFSMVRLDREPLHASAVMIGGGVVAFVGESGDGKSTLAAHFLRAGCPVVTDDMLVLVEQDDRFVVQAGPPRIKLYRDVASRVLGADCRGVPMNVATEKLIIPLECRCPGPAPLAAIYLIGKAADVPEVAAPAITALPPARALPRLLAATAAHWSEEPARLRRQFEFVTRLAAQIPVKTLAYPRRHAELGRVMDAVVADLRSRLR